MIKTCIDRQNCTFILHSYFNHQKLAFFSLDKYLFFKFLHLFYLYRFTADCVCALWRTKGTFFSFFFLFSGWKEWRNGNGKLQNNKLPIISRTDQKSQVDNFTQLFIKSERFSIVNIIIILNKTPFVKENIKRINGKLISWWVLMILSTSG